MTAPPEWLGDLLTVELAPGTVLPLTYGAGDYGDDLYGGALAWEPWTCDVAELRIIRGRQNQWERAKTGTLELSAVGRLPAWYGDSNPGTVDVQPAGRPIRVLLDGRPLFVGTVQLAEVSWIGPSRVWQIVGVDDLARLAQIVPAGITRPVELQTERLAALLAYGGISWAAPAPSWGAYVQALDGESQRTLADHVGITLDTWSPGATFVADRTGLVATSAGDAWVAGRTIRVWATDPPPSPPSRWALLGCPTEVVISWDVNEVKNEASLANTGGTANLYSDAVSLGRYGRRSYQRHDLIADPPNTAGNVKPGGAWQSSLAQYGDAKGRITSAVWDLWSFPPPDAWAEVVAGLDVTHDVYVRLPPDETGQAWHTYPRILGLELELGPRRATVRLAVQGDVAPTSTGPPTTPLEAPLELELEEAV